METWPKNWPTIIDGIIEREVEGTVWLPVESCEFRKPKLAAGTAVRTRAPVTPVHTRPHPH